jgi:hypothetical protein
MQPPARTIRFNTLSGLDLYNVEATLVTHRAKRAVRLVETPGEEEEHAIAVLTNSKFRDGRIQAEIAGAPRADVEESARGFVGIAFHVQPRGEQFEYFFLRPTNARAEDQLRRNHSLQYASHPDYPWFRLRDESPGVYESYTDLVPGAWTRVRIEVAGVRARLYVNGAAQPSLVVNDLKLGAGGGQIALWIGGGTKAHFASVTVKSAKRGFL